MTWEELEARVKAALDDAGETTDVEIEYIDIPSIIHDEVEIFVTDGVIAIHG